jgi:hypothetical protein
MSENNLHLKSHGVRERGTDMRSVGLWTKNEKQDEKLKVLQR